MRPFVFFLYELIAPSGDFGGSDGVGRVSAGEELGV